jgi:formamidopyrimidine-DNA glycosylase
MWVDERTGLPCHVCGTAVAWGYHPNEFRKSWYCPQCQGVEWAPTTAGALSRLT